MAANFRSLTFTPHVLDAQQHYFGHAQPQPPGPGEDVLTREETSFIEARDHFAAKDRARAARAVERLGAAPEAEDASR